MPLPKTGLRTVPRRRPDGSLIRTDYYDRKTGEHLGTDRAAALARTGHAPQAAARPTTFGDLCTAYLGSPEFKDLGVRTRGLNRLYVDQLRERYGDLQPASITRPVVRALRDAHADQPYKGNRLIATLRRLFSYGIEIGMLKVNSASKPGRLKEAPREQIWTDDQIDRYLKGAPVRIRRALALFLFTVQRPSDVMAMTQRHLSQHDGRIWVSLRQQKTDELIDVPLHRTAVEILAEPLPAMSNRRASAVANDLLVPSPTGRPWAYRNFARAWDAWARRVDHRYAREVIATWPPRLTRTDTQERKDKLRSEFVGQLQRRDFRRTGMVKMALAGATPSQIAACSGHTIDRVMKILDTYIPRRGEIARAGIEMWEAGAGQRLVSQSPGKID